MTEAQKYKRKKNILIITSMFLLLVFVCLICYIIIYAKMHPKKEFVSPDTIEVVNMNQIDYVVQANNVSFTEIKESTVFNVTENENIAQLKVNENKEIVNAETNEKVQILLNDVDINNNIKIIYQTNDENLILTEDGKLYRLLDTNLLENNTLNVGQIMSNMNVRSVVNMNVNTDGMYVLTNNNRLIDIYTQKEYDGIIRELTTNNGTIYVYNDFSFGFEKGKAITNQYGNLLKFNLMFDNKIVDERAMIYEIDFANKTITTSKLGTLVQAGYAKDENEKYTITIEANTGYHTFNSDYYYTK